LLSKTGTSLFFNIGLPLPPPLRDPLRENQNWVKFRDISHMAFRPALRSYKWSASEKNRQVSLNQPAISFASHCPYFYFNHGRINVVFGYRSSRFCKNLKSKELPDRSWEIRKGLSFRTIMAPEIAPETIISLFSSFATPIPLL
jgi:hypothetical protein